ncbi:MAG: hypothetical protein EBR23_05920 [Planctomycetia bacterium]|nr:hypothetical protein [Planctomycetia bacterium]
MASADVAMLNVPLTPNPPIVVVEPSRVPDAPPTRISIVPAGVPVPDPATTVPLKVTARPKVADSGETLVSDVVVLAGVANVDTVV